VTRLEFCRASAEHAEKVEAFNQRLAVAGQTYHRLSVEKPFRTMLHGDQSPVIAERFLCLENDEVRGGIGIKRMMFRVCDSNEEVAVSVYPVSEGIINPAYSFIGLMIQKEMLRRFPLMYSLGAPSTTPAKLKQRTGWYSMPVPFHFKVLRAGAFLRNMAYLRKKRWLRNVMDMIALSGAGSLSLGLFNLFQKAWKRYPDIRHLSIERFDCWGDWADEVWSRARDQYTLIGDRSKAVLQSLYPDGHQHLIKLRISAKDTGRLLGWAVITASQLKSHRYFGDMRLGAIVDMLAEPKDAYRLLSGALVAMQRSGSDLVVVNHSDQRWNEAFARAGMLQWKTNFHLFLSPKLLKRFEPIKQYDSRFYFTRGDGHGPTQFWLVEDEIEDFAPVKSGSANVPRDGNNQTDLVTNSTVGHV
jgi:hypothetical protein